MVLDARPPVSAARVRKTPSGTSGRGSTHDVQEGYLDHWSSAAERHDDDPDWAFARPVIEMQKVVTSRSPLRFQRDRTDVRIGRLEAVVDGLKRETEGNIICFGGANFGSLLLKAGLVTRFNST